MSPKRLAKENTIDGSDNIVDEDTDKQENRNDRNEDINEDRYEDRDEDSYENIEDCNEDNIEGSDKELQSISQSLPSVLLQPQNRSTAAKLAIYMILMVILPITVYFLFESYVLEDHDSRMTYSGIIAVIMVKVITTSYAISSWNEKDDEYEEIENKQDTVNKKER